MLAHIGQNRASVFRHLEIVLAKKQQPIIISVDDSSEDDEEGTFLQKGQNTTSALARFRFGDKESDIAAPVSLKEEEKAEQPKQETAAEPENRPAYPAKCCNEPQKASSGQLRNKRL